MTTGVVERTTRPVRPGGRWDRLAAWSLLAALALVLGAGFVLGVREDDVSELRAKIASGEVTEVRLSQQLPDDSIGYQPVTISWTEHGLRHATNLTQASSERQARQVQRPRDEVVVGDVAEALATGGREVTVVGTSSVSYFSGGGIYTTLVGVHAPGWVGLAWLAIVCATLFLVGASSPGAPRGGAGPG